MMGEGGGYGTNRSPQNSRIGQICAIIFGGFSPRMMNLALSLSPFLSPPFPTLSSSFSPLPFFLLPFSSSYSLSPSSSIPLIFPLIHALLILLPITSLTSLLCLFFSSIPSPSFPHILPFYLPSFHLHSPPILSSFHFYSFSFSFPPIPSLPPEIIH